MPRLESNETERSATYQGSSNGKASTELRAVTSNESSEPITQSGELIEPDHQHYRVYKRRFFGLAQLALLNIIVSWDWLTFAAVSTTSSRFFDVPQSSINWLSTAFLFAFVVVAPLVLWTLNKGGPKHSMLVASALVFVGNWIRYGELRLEHVLLRNSTISLKLFSTIYLASNTLTRPWTCLERQR